MLSTHDNQISHQATLNNILIFVLWLLVCILSKVIPHFPGSSPLIVLSLFVGAAFSRRMALALILLSVLIADVLLSVLQGYTPFGSWTWFTYSALLANIILGNYIFVRNTITHVFGITFTAVVVFWLWTNFGVWLFSTMYTLNLHGFFHCFMMALPFLERSLLSNMVWGVILYCALQSIRSHQTLIRSGNP